MSRGLRSSLRTKSLRGPRAAAVHGVLAFLAALALLGSQALSALHYAFVPHYVCALHGVLEDGDRASEVLRPRQNSRLPALVDVRDRGHAHDACSVAARSERGAAPPPAQVRSCDAPAAVAPATRAGVDVAPDRAALLARAPKLSPPIG